eukprot:3419927-Pyramimonas_sp.AAC.1
MNPLIHPPATLRDGGHPEGRGTVRSIRYFLAGPSILSWWFLSAGQAAPFVHGEHARLRERPPPIH